MTGPQEEVASAFLARPAFLTRPDGTRIGYCHTPAREAGAGRAGVLFLGGFKSDMTGTKAMRLEAFCREQGRQFTRFDYRAHGVSSGDFVASSIADWADDAVAVLDEVAQGPLVLVGSSMGGWIMLLAALARPGRIRALVGIAPAPDFVLRMAEALTPAQREALAKTGRFERPTPYADDPYVVGRRLIEEGRGMSLLHQPIPIGVPVRLLHGIEDDAVPWQLSMTLADRLRSPDVRVSLVKGGDHRLSSDADLDLLCRTVAEVW